MIWLTEHYDNEVKALSHEARRQGHQVVEVGYYQMQEDHSLPKSVQKIDDKACLLYYGSIQCGLWIMRNKPWVPGCWYDVAEYRCAKYYASLGQYLFNSRYAILPRAEIERRKDELFRDYGFADGIFVRPDSNSKTFTGQVFYQDTWDSEWRKAAYRTEPDELCIVSMPKNILGEWRFFVAEGEVITGSQYRKDNSSEVEEGYPDGALAMAQEIAKKYNPDPMWSIDIAKDNFSRYSLLEIGNFCTAGLYASDLKKLVETASRLAVKEHADIYDI